MRATWYVLEDGAVVDPCDVAPDAEGRLRHKSGVLVAMRGQVPSSRGVDLGEVNGARDHDRRDVTAGNTGRGYKTRGTKAH